MKVKMIIATFAATLSIFSATAQEGGWTLRQCIDYAIENNLTVLKSENTVEQTKVDVNTAKWARLPNLNAGVNQNFNWGRGESPVDNTYTTVGRASTSFSLTTNVPLFTGMQIPNQYQLSKLNLKAAIEDLNQAKDDIALNVTLVYMQVLFNKELSIIADEQIKLSKEQQRRMESLEKLGKSSIAQLAETKARVAQDEMSAVEAGNNYKLSLLELSQLLELPSPDNFSIEYLDRELEFTPLTHPDAIYLEAVNYRPNILAAQYRLEGGEKSIRIAQSAYYPQLSFGADLGTSFNLVEGRTVRGTSFFHQLDENLGRTIGFNLSIPIFNRFSTRNRVRTAKLKQTYMGLQLDETKKTLYKEIQQAWYNAVAAEAKYRSSKVAVEANNESFRLMSEKFENQKATSLEFNEAKLNLMKALSDQTQAKYEYIFRTKILDFYKGMPIK